MIGRLRILVAAGGLLCASAGWAQEIDYASAEALFGEPVTVSATGEPQRASDVPADLEIITADQIRRSGATNIPDLLQFVTGLDVRRYGQLDASVGVRGYNTALNPRVLVLVDGRQVSQDDLGFTPWALIPVPMSSIRQIEVIKGPNAALYGFNAVSGVINIVTYNPLYHDQNSAEVRGGTQSTHDEDFVATLQNSRRWGVRLSGRATHADPFDKGTPGDRSVKPQVETAALDMAFRIAPGVNWRLSGSYGRLSSPYYTDVGYYAQVADTVYSLRTVVSADTRFGLLGLDAYRNDAALALPFDGFSLQDSPVTTVVKASDLYRINPSNTLRLGVSWRQIEDKSAQVFSGQITESTVSGSLMWSWQITPRWSWTNSGRIDALRLDHDGPQFEVPSLGPLYKSNSLIAPSFNSGIVYKPDDSDTWRLLVGRAYRLPSVEDFGLALNLGVAAVVGDPELLPSKVTNYEIDYERTLSSLASRLKLAVFARNTAHPISSAFGSAPSVLPSGEVLIRSKNLDDSNEYGGEIEFRGAARGYNWRAGYALNIVNDKTPSAILAHVSSASFERQTPVSSFVVALGRSWQRLSVDAEARWQSAYQDYTLPPRELSGSPVNINDYWVVNARVGYRLTKHATLSLDGQQINASHLMQTAGHRVPRRVMLALRVDF